MPASFPTSGLYAITDGPRADLVAICERVLRGGAALLQYRDKTTEHDRRRSEAAALVKLGTRYGVPVIINDDAELAAEVGASGVHLGEEDGEIAAARSRLGRNAIIGLSCYDSLERARQLVATDVDYLAFGAFFPSPTKPQARRATFQLLADARSFSKPLVAIGGITPDNAVPLIQAGASFVAVISGVFGAADPELAARRYVELFQK
jgi:thiamine-phosphate pyrophosphorylase